MYDFPFAYQHDRNTTELRPFVFSSCPHVREQPVHTISVATPIKVAI